LKKEYLKISNGKKCGKISKKKYLKNMGKIEENEL